MASCGTVEGFGVLERAVELAHRGEDFVLATVVWREGPTSGQHGSRAILTGDGDIHGWIGGACAEPVFVREAMKALADRAPRLLALGDPVRFSDLPEGTVPVGMSCQSEGALQVYIEPVFAAPHVVVVGRSPMADMLHRLAGELGWNSELVAGDDFTTGQVTAGTFVVVATQGHGDEDVIEQAAKASPAYLGVVASHKRGDSLRAYLAERDLPADVIDSIHCPAGLDLGHTTHNEMAVSILAELVQLRATGALTGVQSGELPQVFEATDPVCGMSVTVEESSISLEYDGETYYFCCPGCRRAFEKDPASYIAEGAT